MASFNLKLTLLLLIMLTVGISAPAMAYDDTQGLKAHSMINSLAFDKFENTIMHNDPYLKNCSISAMPVNGMAIESDQRGDWAVTDNQPRASDIKTWICYGGFTADEPEYPSALTHFYDPSNTDTPWLTDQQIGVTFYRTEQIVNYANPFATVGPKVENPHISAKELALHGTTNIAVLNDYFVKDYSWDRATTYYKVALGSKEENNKYYGQAYRGLGEVMHLMADMCLPAHVRNDGHAAILQDTDPVEGYTSSQDVQNNAGYPYTNSVPYYKNVKGKDVANDPDTLFTEVAKWTHNNFFSKDTIVLSEVKGGKGVVGDYLFRTIDGNDTLAAHISQRFTYDDNSPPKLSYNIDDVVVNDQRKYLIPTAVEADAVLMDRFFPRFVANVEVEPADPLKPGDEYWVRVKIHNEPTEEWPDQIVVNNGAYVIVNGKTTKLDLRSDGSNVFENTMTLKEGDDVRAEFDLGGLVVNSAEITVSATPTPTPTSKPVNRKLVQETQTVTVPEAPFPLKTDTGTLDGGITYTQSYYTDATNSQKLHGLNCQYYPNGNVKLNDTYIKGVRVGYSMCFTSSGIKTIEAYYGDNGVCQYRNHYDETTGKLTDARNYWEDGETTKTFFWYDKNGQLSVYVENDRSGHQTLREDYKDGKLVSSK